MNVEARRRRGDEGDIRAQALDLAFDEVHGTEQQNLAPADADQIGQRAALDIIIQAKRVVLHRDGAEILVQLAGQGGMQAWDHADGKGLVLIILATPYRVNLFIRHAAVDGDVAGAFRADHHRPGLVGDVGDVHGVVEM
ncbi:MAG TPA: hypothetical protein DC046_18375, partial [Rhodospirillaceae bacterium]|nr:hypothetical protein [Rhodospirillaceae bacterium]